MLATLAIAVVVASFGFSSLGCKQEVLCPALEACGGPRDSNGNSMPPISLLPADQVADRQQEWVLAPGHPSCTEDLYVPANDTRLGRAPILPGGATYPEPAVFDWCILLVTGPKEGSIQVKPPRFFYESGPIGAASIKYDQTGHFASGITRTGTFTLDFPSYCLRAFGAMSGRIINPNNTDLGTGDLCKQLEVPIRASGLGEGSYRNVTCIVNPYDLPGQEGCLCTFDVTETGGPSGRYGIAPDNTTIVHIPGMNFPQEATFCQQGDRLQLTGKDGLYLFDQRGVRTFDLVRACKIDAECTSGFCVLQPPGSTVQGICGSRP